QSREAQVSQHRLHRSISLRHSTRIRFTLHPPENATTKSRRREERTKNALERANLTINAEAAKDAKKTCVSAAFAAFAFQRLRHILLHAPRNSPQLVPRTSLVPRPRRRTRTAQGPDTGTRPARSGCRTRCGPRPRRRCASPAGRREGSS